MDAQTTTGVQRGRSRSKHSPREVADLPRPLYIHRLPGSRDIYFVPVVNPHISREKDVEPSKPDQLTLMLIHGT